MVELAYWQSEGMNFAESQNIYKLEYPLTLPVCRTLLDNLKICLYLE